MTPFSKVVYTNWNENLYVRTTKLFATFSRQQVWRVGVEVFLKSRSRKIILARVESRSRKNMLKSGSQSFAGMEGFYAMNKLPKYTFDSSKSRPASVLQIS